jgi:hypothetical protein
MVGVATLAGNRSLSGCGFLPGLKAEVSTEILMSPCVCTHELAAHLGHRTGRAGAEGCLVEECRCVKFRQAVRKKSATITPEELSFARWQVKTLKRMAREIEQMYGLSE